MNKSDIITLPAPALRQRSQKVRFLSEEVRQAITGMQAATTDWEQSRAHEVGVALAAVQVNVLSRIVIIRNDFDNKEDHTFSVFLNPEIVKCEGAPEEDYEGCLSVHNIYGKVPRYPKVRVRATGLNGKTFRLTATGFLARTFQHEIDHTNGILFIDHIKDRPKAFFKLQDNGELTQLDYEKDVRNSRILW
jgi:peptide deformylase